MDYEELRKQHSAALKILLSVMNGYQPTFAERCHWTSVAGHWWENNWRERRDRTIAMELETGRGLPQDTARAE